MSTQPEDEASSRPNEVPAAEAMPEVRSTTGGWRSALSKSAHFVGALFLLVLSIQLMKAGAAPIGARLADTPLIDNAVSTLGFGWLGANVVLSGSPIAIVALNFYAENVLTPLQTFTMITGSRLGASFVVLLVGVLYSWRSRDRLRTVGMGVLAISWSAAVYIPGMFLGYLILKSGMLNGIQWTASSEVSDLIDLIWGPLVDFFKDLLPAPLLFPLGLLVILIAFKLLDAVLPDLDSERHADSRSHWLKRPWPMFALGCVAALLTLSVSVALTALVPLAAKGHVTRREAIPYIAGANITTLADTLLVAMLIGKPGAVQIVLATAIAVTVITLAILALIYGPMTRGIIALDDWVVGTTRRTWGFVAALFLVPIILFIVGAFLPVV